jgi:hypothetical protein
MKLRLKKLLLVLLCSLVFVSSVSALSCGDTIINNTVMTGDLSGCAGAPGITIGASDITLDCDGYSIIMADPSTAITGSSLNNILIKDCNISGANNAGVYLEYTTNSTIENTSSAGLVWGIYFLGGDSNEIINSYGSGEQGIDLEGSPNAKIINSDGIGGYNGIWSLSSDNVEIIDSLGVGGTGILIQNGINNIITSSNGSAINQGIYILDGTNNQIIDSVAIGLDGILLESTT